MNFQRFVRLPARSFYEVEKLLNSESPRGFEKAIFKIIEISPKDLKFAHEKYVKTGVRTTGGVRVITTSFQHPCRPLTMREQAEMMILQKQPELYELKFVIIQGNYCAVISG